MTARAPYGELEAGRFARPKPDLSAIEVEERAEAAELSARGGRIVRVYGRWGPPARYEIPHLVTK